jgi:dihydrofolate reductase
MRKLKLQVQMSVNGCIAGPNGEMDWMVGLLDEELKNMNTNYMSLLIPFSWDGK